MIKATGHSKDGRGVIILGLSEMNLSRLREGKPIHIFGAEFGNGQQDIIIFWGPTEELMARDLEQFGATRSEPRVKQ